MNPETHERYERIVQLCDYYKQRHPSLSLNAISKIVCNEVGLSANTVRICVQNYKKRQ